MIVMTPSERGKRRMADRMFAFLVLMYACALFIPAGVVLFDTAFWALLLSIVGLYGLDLTGVVLKK